MLGEVGAPAGDAAGGSGAGSVELYAVRRANDGRAAEALLVLGAARQVVQRLLDAVDGETGQPLVNIGQVMADPKWATQWPALAANPLANKVGWFDLNNINCGLLGMPLGFLVMTIVSLLGKEPPKEMQALVDEIRKPRGRTVLEEKTT